MQRSGAAPTPSPVAVGAVGVHGRRILAPRLAHELPEAMAEVLHLAGAQHAAHPQQLPRRMPAATQAMWTAPQDKVLAAPGDQVGAGPAAEPREQRSVPGQWVGAGPGAMVGAELHGVPRSERSVPRGAHGLRQGGQPRTGVIAEE